MPCAGGLGVPLRGVGDEEGVRQSEKWTMVAMCRSELAGGRRGSGEKQETVGGGSVPVRTGRGRRASAADNKKAPSEYGDRTVVHRLASLQNLFDDFGLNIPFLRHVSRNVQKESEDQLWRFILEISSFEA